MADRRVMLIGLDCVPPRLAFDLFQDEMPNLTRLRAQGCFGALESCVPPITVPAWSVMLSGRDPGELGMYGFQQLVAGSYQKRLSQPRDLCEPRVWELVGRQGKRVAALFVPPSYPPESVAGVQVSCFLTPDSDSLSTHPPELAAELRAKFGPYEMDVDEFRTDDKAPVLAGLVSMTKQHFAIARHVWTTRKPDLMTMVAIGPDRFHHAFYQDIEPKHPKYDATGPFADAGRMYYRLLDEQLGSMLELADEDTAVLVVSDHGARPLLGGFCINEWLIEQGYLSLHSYPSEVTGPGRLHIDWSRTRVVGEGGYCGRIRFNVLGREPQGTVSPSDLEPLRRELMGKLAAVPGPDGAPTTHRMELPTVYRKTRGIAPDLQVFFGDLDYRAIGTVGHRALYIDGNDAGPDGCNHDWHGIFAMAGAGVAQRGKLSGCSLYDVTPTLLGLLGLAGPGDLRGCDLSLTQEEVNGAGR